VPGVRALLEVSVTYRRRTNSTTESSSSSSDSVSRCGPRVNVLIDDKRIWSNSATIEFGSEGVVSGNVEFLVPTMVPMSIDLTLTKNKHCEDYDLQMWDPRYEVRPIESVPGGVDPQSPRGLLKK